MELKRIAEGVYYSPPDHRYDQPCLYAVAGSRRILMIDGGVSPGRAREFLSALREASGRGADFTAVTHWHWDHTFGLAGTEAPIIACRNTQKHLKRMAGYASWSDEALEERIRSGEEIENCAGNIRMTYPGHARETISIRQPDIVFDEAIETDLGGLTCRLSLLPPVHTDDSVAIFVPELKLLFIGDSMCQNSYAQPTHYSAPAVLQLMEFIRGTDAEIVAESHAEPSSAVEFFACSGILETAARCVLSGIDKAPLLKECLRREAGGVLPEGTDEIVSLFMAGIGR